MTSEKRLKKEQILTEKNMKEIFLYLISFSTVVRNWPFCFFFVPIIALDGSAWKPVGVLVALLYYQEKMAKNNGKILLKFVKLADFNVRNATDFMIIKNGGSGWLVAQRK